MQIIVEVKKVSCKGRKAALSENGSPVARESISTSVYNAWLLRVVLGRQRNSPIERHVSDVHYSDVFLLLILVPVSKTLVSRENPGPFKSPKCGE
jgi:hypothetical protein